MLNPKAAIQVWLMKDFAKHFKKELARRDDEIHKLVVEVDKLRRLHVDGVFHPAFDAKEVLKTVKSKEFTIKAKPPELQEFPHGSPATLTPQAEEGLTRTVRGTTEDDVEGLTRTVRGTTEFYD